MATSTSAHTPVAPRGRFTISNLRWVICGLLFFGSLVNYVDRGTIAILAHPLQQLFHWTETDYGWIVFAFQLAYAIMMVLSGSVIDGLGTRAGYALAMAWWSIAAMGHALARGVASFAAARFLLGAGEAGTFPASIKAVAEWFPKRERALATGIFNAGTNVGAVAAYPLVGWLLLEWGWKAAFVGTGGLGLICLVIWLAFYRLPRQHPWVRQNELEHIESRHADEQEAPTAQVQALRLSETKNPSESPVPPGRWTAGLKTRVSIWASILGYRQAWGFTLAKFMTDPVWWFYIFWLPKYLIEVRHFSIARLELFGMIPFLAAAPGSIAGGWLSGFLIRRGRSVNAARKIAMLVCAFSMPAGILAVFSGSPGMALAFISLATSAHQGWSANVYTLASDMFSKEDVASVVGLGGAAGAAGGMIIAPVAGYLLQWLHSYAPLFIIAGVMHPLALAVVQRLIPRIEPVQALCD
jgi:MFS transporter, ACS family, hexuronate transporter